MKIKHIFERIFERPISEIKSGEHLEIYITLVAASIIAVLSIFQIATSYVPSAVLMVLNVVLFATLQNRRNYQDIRSWVEQLKHGDTATELGLVKHHRKLNFVSLFDELQNGDELLWLGTYSPNHNEFLDAFSSALKRGVKIRMLVIEPGSQNMIWRAQEIGIGYSPNNFQKEVELFISRISEHAQSAQGGRNLFEIRTYSDLPGIPIYLIVRQQRPFRGYSGFYLTKTATYSPYLEWKLVADGMLQRMHDHFNRKWEAQSGANNPSKSVMP